MPSIREGSTDSLAAKGLQTGQGQAVGYDQGDEEAEHLVEFVHPGVHAQVHQGHHGRDDQDVNGDTDFLVM